MARVQDYIRESSLRAAVSTSGSGLMSQSYKNMVRGTNQNRFRTDYIPRNIASDPIPNPQFNTMKITLPMGTVLFRATGHPPDPNSNMNETKFHYFYPFAGLAVAGLSDNYSRFCMFALKYDTNFFLLLEPNDKTKRWVTHRNAAGYPTAFSGPDDALNKDLCRAAGVQGWIGLSSADALQHIQLADEFPMYFNKPYLMGDTRKFVHFNSFTKTQGYAGFPECVMWYEDLQYTPTSVNNRRKKMVIEPITCLHMPKSGTKGDKMDYIVGFYTQVLAEGLLKLKTTAKVSGGGTIPFAHFVFPEMSTKALAKGHIGTSRPYLN